ncbi:MAG: hypothetical protein EA402_14670 [Planctomycetota bacterium]|nr:MAG: hypothetical protein EA402_14670 [Planctomycetota bacterium]
MSTNTCTVRRFPSEALAQLAADLLKSQGIQAQVVGTDMDIGDALNPGQHIQLLIEREHEILAREILDSNGL